MAQRIGKYKVSKREAEVSLRDGGVINGAVSVRGKANFHGGIVKTIVTNGGEAVTLTEANSGAICTFNTAGASTFTLPAPEAGMYFTFISTITATGDHEIIAATNDYGFLGGCLIMNTTADQTNAFSAATDGENVNRKASGGAGGEGVEGGGDGSVAIDVVFNCNNRLERNDSNRLKHFLFFFVQNHLAKGRFRFKSNKASLN